MKSIDVACAVIVNEGRILAAQRSLSMSLPLKWEFPGGKIQHNESPEQCIHREIKEELTIEIVIVDILKPVSHQYTGFVINLIPFIAKYLQGDLILKEHVNIRWCSRNELSALDWAPADTKILDQLLQLDLFRHD